MKDNIRRKYIERSNMIRLRVYLFGEKKKKEERTKMRKRKVNS